MTSILVRKNCQPILDQAGYPMFFCTISDNYHYPSLEIYTTCGKPFAEVHGVTFSRHKPTIAECEYSAVLLEQWLARHKKDFEAYVDAYTDFYSIESPEHTLNKNKFSVRIESKTQITIYRTFDYITDKGHPDTYEIRYILDSEAKAIRSISWPSHVHIVLPELIPKFKLSAHIIKTALNFKAEHVEYWKAREQLEKITEVMRTCKI